MQNYFRLFLLPLLSLFIVNINLNMEKKSEDQSQATDYFSRLPNELKYLISEKMIQDNPAQALNILSQLDKNFNAIVKRINSDYVMRTLKENPEDYDNLFLQAAKDGNLLLITAILLSPWQGTSSPDRITELNGNNALILATMNGHIDIVKILLNKKIFDPNLINGRGNTALIEAVIYDHPEIIKILLANPLIDPNITDSDGNTALILATINSDLHLIKIILDNQNTNPNIKGSLGQTSLMLADDEEIAKYILADKKTNPNIQDNDGNTALINAVLNDNINIIRDILNNPKTDISIRNNDNKNAEEIAYEIDNDQALDLFVRHKIKGFSLVHPSVE